MFVIFLCLLCNPLILGIGGFSALVSSMDSATREELLRRCSAGPSDLILFLAGHHASVNKTLGHLRVYVAQKLGLIDHVSWHLLFK
jgi:aspartyl-tRNA synthetase